MSFSNLVSIPEWPWEHQLPGVAKRKFFTGSFTIIGVNLSIAMAAYPHLEDDSSYKPAGTVFHVKVTQ